MATLTYTLSAEDYAIHKERILRRRADVYQQYLKQFDLEDTTANQNAFVRIMGMNVIDKFLKQLQAEDINDVLRSQITDSGLS